jgi:hypothetical protein
MSEIKKKLDTRNRYEIQTFRIILMFIEFSRNPLIFPWKVILFGDGEE